jgi:NADH dehydrogenase
MNNSTSPTVIVGGGFVGLFTALHLSHRHYSNPIILIDPQARFVFKPLLYEYLTGEMQDEQVLPRYEELLEGSKVVFVQDKVINIDLEQHRVELLSGIHYDYHYLVLGVGSTQGYFGTEGAEENAFAFRTQADAIALARHLRECLQKASQTEDSQVQRSLLTFAVTGAGPSGVEIAATLADLLPSWYAKLGGNIRDIRIAIVNHGEILSGDVNAHLQEIALEALKNRTVPVELLLGVKVTAVDANGLKYQRKDKEAVETLQSKTTIWTAGTANNSLIESLTQIKAQSKNKHGLPLVTSSLQLVDFPEVFAAGDCAVVKDHPFPPVAQIAYQQGAGIAHNIIALAQGKEPQPITARMRGTLMKLGLGNGVANLFDKMQVKGKPGDLIRNSTYLEMLPTPVHNFKATTEWLTDEIFEHHAPKAVTPPQKKSQSKRTIAWIGGAVAAVILVTGSLAIWRTTQPSPQQQPNQKQSLV